MQYILMVLCLVFTVGIMLLIKSLQLNAGFTVVLVVPTVFVVIYLLAKIQMYGRVSEQNAVKE